MRILLFILLPTIAFCQTFAVDSVYRNGIIHPHEEHEWVVSDTTLRDFDSELGFGEYWIVAPPKRHEFFTVCRLCGRKLRWSELPPTPPNTEFKKVDSMWADTGLAYILNKGAKCYGQQPKLKQPKYVIGGGGGKPKRYSY